MILPLCNLSPSVPSSPSPFLLGAFLFAGVILLLGLGLPWLFADVKRSTVSCRCGACRTDDAVIFEPGDELRISDILSENCPICRTRRSGPQTRPAGTKAQRHEGTKAGSAVRTTSPSAKSAQSADHSAEVPA
jgi:hypothetical protein